jgi:hypothetical protein
VLVPFADETTPTPNVTLLLTDKEFARFELPEPQDVTVKLGFLGVGNP